MSANTTELTADALFSKHPATTYPPARLVYQCRIDTFPGTLVPGWLDQAVYTFHRVSAFLTDFFL
jgi:hypothetical protein